MSISEDFSSYLSSRLPSGVSLHVYHVSTAPTSCPPLYAAAPGQSEERTECESHFLAISQQQEPTTNLNCNSNSHTIVLGIEVLVFTSSDLTTIFVSKADSTGFLSRQSTLPRGISLAQVVIASFLDFLVSSRPPGPRLVLSLFARSQNQYLFPGSIENASKHVLDDRQLIKWWCRVLDPLVHRQSGEQQVGSSVTQAYIVVPGCDRSETRVFFPPSTRFEVGTEAKWIARYPVELLVRDDSAPPRCLVPRLPDDPKARFLDDLDGNQVNSEGKWSGVKSLDQFWELMSYRQECSAGRLVGFVWVVFPRQTPCQKLENTDLHPSGNKQRSVVTHDQNFDKNEVGEDRIGQSQTIEEEPITLVSADSAKITLNDDSGLSLLQSSDKCSNKSMQNEALANAKVNNSPSQTDRESQGHISLSQSDYSMLMDYLLELDFAGVTLAAQSTTDWINKIKSIADRTSFGSDVEGKMVTQVKDGPTNNGVVASQATNVLTAVRKKRKADPVETSAPNPSVNELVVNALGTSLIRKKPKP